MLTALYGQLARGSDKRKGLSAKTITYIHSTLHKVLADAVDAGLLGKNVAAGAKPPRPARRAVGSISA
jgi:site-specific recombinase XerC